MARSALIQPTQQMQFFNLPSGETLLKPALCGQRKIPATAANRCKIKQIQEIQQSPKT
jgi:hypothetical protein